MLPEHNAPSESAFGPSSTASADGGQQQHTKDGGKNLIKRDPPCLSHHDQSSIYLPTVLTRLHVPNHTETTNQCVLNEKEPSPGPAPTHCGRKQTCLADLPCGPRKRAWGDLRCGPRNVLGATSQCGPRKRTWGDFPCGPRKRTWGDLRGDPRKRTWAGLACRPSPPRTCVS